MKEATGELNMTVITLVAIAAIGAVFYFIVWPLVQQTLVTQTCRSTYGLISMQKELEMKKELGIHKQRYIFGNVLMEQQNIK